MTGVRDELKSVSVNLAFVDIQMLLKTRELIEISWGNKVRRENVHGPNPERDTSSIPDTKNQSSGARNKVEPETKPKQESPVSQTRAKATNSTPQMPRGQAPQEHRRGHERSP